MNDFMRKESIPGFPPPPPQQDQFLLVPSAKPLVSPMYLVTKFLRNISESLKTRKI